jgi:uncharacterized protein (TIGR02598 family)
MVIFEDLLGTNAVKNSAKTFRKRAFSLIEVIFAMSIFSFAIISVLGLMAVGLRGFKEAGEKTVQSNIVQAMVSDFNMSEGEDMRNRSPAENTKYYDVSGNRTDFTKRYYTAVLTILDTEAWGEAIKTADTISLAIDNKTRPGVTNVFTTVVYRNTFRP